ncbi:bifunctional YncE family protein/alkaline phosphatase family protein [Sphingomonas sp. PWP1-2]|uniref:bifunctional YncE family protein/alkaline phosphatase family protein n=1 Tax=Sphingomonas sp. PWP1-2 TaxID=2804558 RepID=UPI003CEA960B
MHKAFLFGGLLAITASVAARDHSEPGVALPTGQRLTPLAAPGARFEPLTTRIAPHPEYVADGAAAIAVSPDGREMLVLTSGFNLFNGSDGKRLPAQSTQYVFRYAIDARGGRLLQTTRVPNSYSGIAWQPDGRGFVVGGGVDDVVHRFEAHGSRFAETRAPIALGHATGNGAEVKPQAAGLAVSPDGRRALVANYYNDSISLIDLAAGKVIAERDLRPGKIDPAQVGVPGGENPFAIVWIDATHAWVSAPRDRQLVALEIIGAAVRVTGRVATLGAPTALLVDPRLGRLYATEDNADRLAIIDLKTGRLAAEPRLGLPDALGAAPLAKGLNANALALLPDHRLLVTMGGINAVALVTPRADGASVDGLVPTGWYPSAVAVSRDGGRVFVVNRKSPPGPNPLGCAPKLAIYRGQPNACGAANQYIFQLEKAGLLQFALPKPAALVRTTLQVADNIGLTATQARAAANATMAAVRARIKHVVFIIKENRTYDQVLGDLAVGNGDPRLAILGERLSPNHHRLARDFVTLDNFYDSGEQSSTGWTWSTAARVPDLLEKTAPVNYAGRGLAYEAEEADRFIYTAQTPAERHATNPAVSTDPDLLPGPALLTAPDGDRDDETGQGFLWNAAIRAGLSVRNYGFSDASVYDLGKPGFIPLEREPAKTGTRIYTPGDRLLASRSDPYFRGFDQKMPDYWRMLEWQREFAVADAKDAVPALTLLRLSHDHFGDFSDAIDGVNTVETQMADNDYALGQVVETIAQSRARDSTLVFVIEDDAQNGADHVDARRSVAFIVGPMVRHNALVSTRYTTVSLLRTIEAVLGLAPLGLNDALAVPMADVFDPAMTGWRYHAVAADVLRATQLPIPRDRFVAAPVAAGCAPHDAAYWAAAMRGQNFATEDRLDTDAFNAALWNGLGAGAQPSTRGGEDFRVQRTALLSGVPAAEACHR